MFLIGVRKRTCRLETHNQNTYLGASVRKSASGATPMGTGDPASHTSIKGQALGLRWQNSKKSNANCPCGKTTRLHCKNPGHTPLVGPVNRPWRTF